MTLTAAQEKKLREIVEATQGDVGYTFVKKDNPSIKKIVTTYELAMVNDTITDGDKVACRATDAGIEYIRNLDAEPEVDESVEDVIASPWSGPISPDNPFEVEEEPVEEEQIEEELVQEELFQEEPVEEEIQEPVEELIEEPIDEEPVVAIPAEVMEEEFPVETSSVEHKEIFEVEDGFVPPVKRSKRRKSKYPFDKMSIGQSFYVPKTERMKDPYRTLTSSCGGANRRYKEEGKRFIVRDWDKGVRVYCVEAK